MKGLRGMPFSYSSWISELNGSPEGSRSTRRHSSSPTAPSARGRVWTLAMLGPGDDGRAANLRVPRAAAHEVQQRLGGVVVGGQDAVGHHRGAGVHEGIARDALLVFQLD